MRITTLTIIAALTVAAPITAQRSFYGSQSLLVDLGTSQADDGPTMNVSETYMVFGSVRSGNVGDYDLWEARRAHIQAPWGSFVNLTALNSTALERGPSLSRDGLELYFFSRRTGAQKIYRSTRATTASPWGAPTEVTGLPNQAGRPSLTDDGLTMFFSALYGTAPILRVHTATRTSTSSSTWTDQGVFPPLNDGNCYNSPSPFANGNIVDVVSSTRTGNPCNSGHGDAYFVYRDALTGQWSSPIARSFLNSSADERGLYRGRTTGRAYVSGRTSGGRFKIYVHEFRSAMMSIPGHPATELDRYTASGNWDLPWLHVQHTAWGLNTVVDVNMYSDRPNTLAYLMTLSNAITGAVPFPMPSRGDFELNPAFFLAFPVPAGPSGVGSLSLPITGGSGLIGSTAAIQCVGVSADVQLDWTIPGLIEITS